MNDQTNPPRPWRRLAFLLPAVLAAVLIFYSLPKTQPVLAAVPELLEYEPTPTPEAREKTDRSAAREAAEAKHADPTAGRSVSVQHFTAPAAYKDGTYSGSAQGFGGVIEVTVTVDEDNLRKGECIACERCANGCPYGNLSRWDRALLRQPWIPAVIKAALLFALGVALGLCRFVAIG